MKFRKKPVVVEATQWWPPDCAEHKAIKGVHCEYIQGAPGGYTAWIKTLEGKLIVSMGDWIITGVKGEKYPCKPDIFEKTYKKIGATTNYRDPDEVCEKCGNFINAY